MAFLRAEKKKSGTYLRIVQSYKSDGKSKHKTLYSLGKLEDYPPEQIERIAGKLLELIGKKVTEITGADFKELGRYNYGYALIILKLWEKFSLSEFVKIINNRRKVKFEWHKVIQFLAAERINEPCSKLRSSFHQSEYLGFSDTEFDLHHFYRALDVLSIEEEFLKRHLYKEQSNLFSSVLDVVFYDVTTLYFDSAKENQGELRQKGYSKDGKAHKTQVVLGLLVDKMRNPISYEIYQGNTYEGKTMIEALKKMQDRFNIDNVVVVADSAMIDKDNRDHMHKYHIDYILGDRIKNMSKSVKETLLNKENHKVISRKEESLFAYAELEYKGRRLICTYSEKRARKDAHEREKLIAKAQKWLEEPSKYKQVKKRGAGRFIETNPDGAPVQLNEKQIREDEKYDGFKAIATTSDLPVEDILSKYRDLYQVEHTFRTLKSQLEVRPVFHWTDSRIRAHISMCFIAYTFINHLRNLTGLQYAELIRALDKMQVSDVMDKKTGNKFYLRSSLSEQQQIIAEKLRMKLPNDIIPHSAVDKMFTK